MGGIAVVRGGVIEASPEVREDYQRTPFVTHRFELDRGTRDELQRQPEPWGWQGLSEALYFRSYSRNIGGRWEVDPNDPRVQRRIGGRQERWADTVTRFIEGVLSIKKDHHLKRRLPWDEGRWREYGAEMALAAARFDWSPPGRGLWAMGTEYVYERGSAALTNCSACDLDIGEDLTQPLGWAMDYLCCVTSDTWVSTSFGPREVKDLVGRPFVAIVDGEAHFSRTGFFKSGRKHTITVEAQGFKLTLTPDHQLMTDRGWTQAGDLREGDLLALANPKGIPCWDGDGTETEGFLLGHLVGDGHFTTDDTAAFESYEPDSEAGETRRLLQEAVFSLPGRSDRAGWAWCESKKCWRMRDKQVAIIANRFGMERHDKHVTPSMEKASSSFTIGFLRGVFDTDGCALASTHDRAIKLKWVDLDSLRAVQRMLLRLGIRSTMSKQHDGGDVVIKSQICHQKPQWQIVITGESRARFAEIVRFSNSRKQTNATSSERNYKDKTTVKVTSVNDNGEQDTYDVQVEDVHAFDANGIKAHNCGAGVGFRISDKPVKMEMPAGPEAIYIIHDTRESWVESYELLIRSYLYGSNPVRFIYDRIRPEGAPLKGIGGFASGPGPLKQIHVWAREACERYIRGEFGPTRLKADLANFLGVCVSMGGIRRSSEILLGSVHDEEFLNLKNYELHPERSAWGYASNNTVLLESHADFLAIPRIADGIRRNGEPGVANLVAIQKWARFGRESHDAATGLNPCTRGDTKILTEEFGEVEIASVIDREVTIWNGWEWSKVTPRVTGLNQQVRLVRLSDGKELWCTPAHVWLIQRASGEGQIRVTTEELKLGNLVPTVTFDRLRSYATIEAIGPLTPIDKVYCFTDHLRHTGTFNGIVTGQCGEICLCPYETCIVNNLYPSRCATRERLEKATRFATAYNSIVALLPSHRAETNRVIAQNRRIGVSIAGLADWLHATSDEHVTRACRDLYKIVREENAILAREAGVPVSIRVTTEKPDGSVAKCAGVSEGVHAHKFPFAIRRMDVERNHQIVPVLIAAGYPHEPTATKPEKSFTFEFPIAAPDGARTVKNQTIWEQLSIAVMMQREWADNSVSITGEFDPVTEGDDVVRALARNIPMLKSFSVLPRDTKAYKQMPYEEITREQYDARKAALRQLDWSGFHSDGEDQRYCKGGFCPVEK